MMRATAAAMLALVPMASTGGTAPPTCHHGAHRWTERESKCGGIRFRSSTVVVAACTP